MTVKELAKKSECKLWKVYHLRKKLGRLPTVDELKNYNKKRGRPTVYFEKEGD